MKELYLTIREGTISMFEALRDHYVFYCLGTGGNVWKTVK